MAVKNLKTQISVGHWEEKWNKWRIPVLLLLLLVLFWYKTNSWPMAAVVNYRPIWRWEFNQAMYNQVGQQVLENLIVEQSIREELAQKRVSVDSAKVDGRVEEIKKQIGSDDSFTQALAFQGLTVEQLKRQINLQLGLEELVEPSTDSAVLAERVYDLVQKLRSEAKVWLVPRGGEAR